MSNPDETLAPLAYAPLPVPRRSPPLWPAYCLTAVLLLAQLFVGFVLAIVVVARIIIADPPFTMEKFNAITGSTALLLGIFTLTMVANAAALAFCLLFSRTPPLERIALRPAKTTVPAIVLFCLATLSIAEFFTLAEALFPIHSASLEGITHVITSSSHLQLLLAGVLIAFVGPVLEELLFRGYIQTRLVQRHGPFLGILITSALFGIFHLDLVQGTFAFTVGLFFGIVAYRTRSVIPSIFCHITINTTSTLLAAYDINVDPAALPILLPALIIFIFALLVLFHTNRRPPAVLAVV